MSAPTRRCGSSSPGTPAPAVPSLRALVASRHEVVAVLDPPGRPRRPGRQLRLRARCASRREHGIRVLDPRATRVRTGLPGRLDELAPDLLHRRLRRADPAIALDIPRLGWVNLHFSLLPAWRGAAPVQHALLAGDEVTGATTFLIEEGLDTGPYFGILPRDPADRHDRRPAGSARRGRRRPARRHLDGLEGGDLTPVPQAGGGRAWLRSSPSRTPGWTGRPGLRVTAYPACTPIPGPGRRSAASRVKLGPVARTDIEVRAPGCSRATLSAQAPTQAVRLGTVKPEGKAEMAAADWLRGLRLEPGERFA